MKIWNETTNFRHLAIIVPIVDLWLRQRGFEVRLIYLVPLALVCFLSIWGIGVLWDRAHMFDYENNFVNKRNPLAMKQLGELEKIRRLMERFK